MSPMLCREREKSNEHGHNYIRNRTKYSNLTMIPDMLDSTNRQIHQLGGRDDTGNSFGLQVATPRTRSAAFAFPGGNK